MASSGMHRSNIYKWIAKYREGGLDALKARKAAGPEPKLNWLQLLPLYRNVAGEYPFQLGFEFALRTHSMEREATRKAFKVRLSDASVGRLLRKLGLSPQRPLHRAYQRDEEKAQAWRTRAFPQIRKLAQKEGAINSAIARSAICTVCRSYPT